MINTVYLNVEEVLKQLQGYTKHNPNAFTKIKNTNKNIMCCCPYHEDDKPSFGISKDPPYVFHCFGCGASGTIDKLIYDFTGSTDILNSLSSNSFNSKPKIDVDSLFKIEQEESEEMEYEKYKGQYPKLLLERGLTAFTLSKYEVYFDKEYIVIPVRDIRGRVRFLHKRGLYNKIYINSTNSRKTDILYGLYYLINSSKKFDSVYLVEGTFDAMACYQAGKPACAVMGSILFKEQVEQLSKYFKVVNLFFDNDKAGRDGVKKAYELILTDRYPLKVNVVEYPNNLSKDANELLKAGDINKITLTPAEVYFMKTICT